MQLTKPDNAVVIGGVGFIGKHVVKALWDSGCSVTVVSRKAAAAGKDGPRLRHVSGAVGNPDAMMRAIDGANVVYDLSMGGGPTWADFQRDYVDGAKNVARACLAHGVRRLIYTSTTAALYLGKKCKVDGSGPADYDYAERRCYYSRGKIEAERALLEMHATSGLPVVVLRPAIVAGPGGRLMHPGIGQWVSGTCLITGSPVGTPRPWVLVQDVASAMLQAKDAPSIEGKTFTLVGDVRLSDREYVRLVAENSLRNIRMQYQNALVFQSVLVFKWFLKKLIRRPDNDFPTVRDLLSGRTQSDIDCSEAKRLLGWQPNADYDVFVREAIQNHIPPIRPGDLRLERSRRPAAA